MLLVLAFFTSSAASIRTANAGKLFQELVKLDKTIFNRTCNCVIYTRALISTPSSRLITLVKNDIRVQKLRRLGRVRYLDRAAF